MVAEFVDLLEELGEDGFEGEVLGGYFLGVFMGELGDYLEGCFGEAELLDVEAEAVDELGVGGLERGRGLRVRGGAQGRGELEGKGEGWGNGILIQIAKHIVIKMLIINIKYHSIKHFNNYNY